MSQLKGVINEKRSHINTLRYVIGVLVVICLGLIGVIFTSPDRLMIFNPPELHAGSQRPWWEIPKSNIYAFAYQTFQQLNRWTVNGQEDYKRNIENLAPLLTPGCQRFLQQDYADRQRYGELRDRTRGVYEIVGRGFSDDKVQVLSRDSWIVNLDLSVDEYFQDEPVKRVFTRFPISIVRMDVDMQRNPWGLGFNCYSSTPLRLEGVESIEGAK
ncbi:PFL_4703 family integrating conjugative element protein [Exercitatus varius]|uniref:PFL_4703 family integrating conjugative element protein n=1 Tax=Exercitatus varius TaxID=67857 RepID=UPI00294B7052|nr:TIGR03746 family integrating conjugative element protein [Exercitatus varius]MDG2961712.1 TIGR03746 family integrating conjugative element protein [Exercitatus varius]